MNCPDFEKMIVDLARDQIMEASVRESGLAHAQDCARCAARLADERVLTQGLRSLAMSAQALEAPARVEAMLLAAFRERDKVALLKPAAQPAPSVSRTHWRWATGIAAAMALLFVAFAATRIQQPSPQQLLLARAPQPLKITTLVPVPVEASSNPAPVEFAGAQGAQSQFVSVRTPGRRLNNLEGINGAGNSRRSLQPVNTLASNSTASDIATDFIPLTYGASFDGMDGGHVVRVELPRTALAQFGLPVNVERSAEPVKADVLMGDDGLARAIRFVR